MNNQDVICINATFNQECLTLYAKYGVKIPVKDKIYTIRTKKRHSHGEWGIKLNEINNPEIPIGFYSDIKCEPTWNICRFVDLYGMPLAESEEKSELENDLKETYNESKRKGN